MYKQFFHLESEPFTINPDPRFLCMMPHTREALACLQHGIASRKGFMVLTGEVGTGKTTLLRHTLNALHRTRIHSAFIFNPRLEIVDFLEFVLSDFGLTPVSRNKSSMIIQLNRWLIDRYRDGEICVIVVDEAQNCSTELLEEIRLLTNLETSSQKLAQIVLSGQPELESKLRQPNVRQLRQRIALWCRTKPLTLTQTAEYIAGRLRIAGTTAEIFLPDAIQLIHKASHGIPRIINLICENALIFAYVDQFRQVPASVAYAAIQDLNLEDDASLLYDPAGHTEGNRAPSHHDLVLQSTPTASPTPAAGTEPKRQTP
jgi:general secretion pathway protein A